MKNSKLKIVLYLFVIASVGWFCLSFFNIQGNWVTPVKYVCIGIDALIIIFLIILLQFAKKDNAKIDSLLKEDKYEELIEYASTMKNAKNVFLFERKYYYYYIEILAYLSLNDIAKAKELLNNFENLDSYPLTLYWKSCIEFSEGIYDNIVANYNRFMSNSSVNKQRYYLENIINTFYSLKMTVEENEEMAIKYYNKVNRSRTSLEIALKALEIVKEKYNIVEEENVGEPITIDDNENNEVSQIESNDNEMVKDQIEETQQNQNNIENHEKDNHE